MSASFDSEATPMLEAVPTLTVPSATTPVVPEEDVPLLGNSHSCCNGRCIRAQDAHASIAIAIIVLCFDGILTYLFVVDMKYLWIIIVNCVITVMVMITLVLSTTTDPAILAKLSAQDPRVKPPPPKGMAEFVTVKGIQVVTPYCHTCRRTRPPRTSHCHYCNNCVRQFDHHCGMIGACVGEGNIRFFFSFLVSIVVKSTWITSFSVWYLAVFWSGEDVARKGLAIVDVVVGVVLCLQIGAMMVHYISLMSKGYTHREHVKRDRLYGKGVPNPYDNGCHDNCYEVWCL